MAHKDELVSSAKKMRKSGVSLAEIAASLHVSKSTVSLWTRGLELDPSAQRRLSDAGDAGRKRGRQTMAERRSNEWNAMVAGATWELSEKTIDAAGWRLIGALLYWCEGGKTGSVVQFMNSDAALMETFLVALRRGYGVDEKRFRAVLHLHDYHDERTQTDYWSKVTGIPVKQFNKPYLKKNGGKNVRLDYPGCLSVRYGDATLVKQLKALYSAFANNLGV